MSYICMLANRRGIAAAGDSRLTFSPLPLHWDRGRKVFAEPERRLLWACCGLTVWGGVNYARLTGRILCRRQWSLEERLEAVRQRVTPALRLWRRMHGRDALFSLLVGTAEPGRVRLLSLDLRNGEMSLRQWPAPAVTEAGWSAELRPPLPDPEALRGASLEELAQRARGRVQWVIDRDRRLHQARPAHRQTVGGPVRWVVLEIAEEL